MTDGGVDDSVLTTLRRTQGKPFDELRAGSGHRVDREWTLIDANGGVQSVRRGEWSRFLLWEISQGAVGPFP
jgi:hypothetical protein